MDQSVMLLTGPDGKGVAILGGKTYRVVSKFSESWTAGRERSIGFSVRLVESLDAEAQERRIAGLEAELERERERLDEIRAALSEQGRESRPSD